MLGLFVRGTLRVENWGYVWFFEVTLVLHVAPAENHLVGASSLIEGVGFFHDAIILRVRSVVEGFFRHEAIFCGHQIVVRNLVQWWFSFFKRLVHVFFIRVVFFSERILVARRSGGSRWFLIISRFIFEDTWGCLLYFTSEVVSLFYLKLD